MKLALLVHGNASSSRAWARIAERYDARGVRVVAPDLPGFGARAAERVRPGPGEDALDPFVGAALAALADAPGGEIDDVYLHGAGIGALVVLRAAVRLGDRAAAVTLHGPVFRHGSGHGVFAPFTRTTIGAAVTLNAAHGPAARVGFLRDQLGPPPYREEELDRLLRDLHRTPAAAFAAYQRAALDPAAALAPSAAPASRPGVRSLRCPVRILWSAWDGVLPPTASGALLPWLPPQTELVVVPGARHAP